ncbi:MAG: hypothetical protein JW837_15515 [Sedimentisphaerales bacterium]|nr:hypothetical protein [Sedimentisphaerales bacterium]
MGDFKVLSHNYVENGKKSLLFKDEMGKIVKAGSVAIVMYSLNRFFRKEVISTKQGVY